ncbi:MAG: ImmA/IrrE family metallo-endopeptidase [Pedobacter sp.]|nr:MAG: ImmA/IrrE family metallo-endopeptidase [Pedobacter sp.]
MAKNNFLKHGFKAKAERLALDYRNKLSIKPHGALDAFALASFLKIPVYDASEFLNLPLEKAKLAGIGDEDCGWSALTMITGAGNRIIIHNPYHTLTRQQSNLMHELSHIICGHEPGSKYDFLIPLGMRSFNEVHEEEAKCLGAILQLPRVGLIWALKRNMNNSEMSDHFNASQEMVGYRLNTSGVLKQLKVFK